MLRPMPNVNSTSAATQHSDAPIPANIAATSEPFGQCGHFWFLSHWMKRRIDPVP